MKEKLLRLIWKLFPELSNGTLIPVFATVTGIPDPPAGGQTNSADRPYYAVNVQVLTPDGDVDPSYPEFRDVPLTLPSAGHGRGFAAFPQVGTVVELAFAYGMQSKPFVRSVLPTDLALPQVDPMSMRIQLNGGSYMEIDAAGLITITTPADIELRSAANIKLYGAKVWMGSPGTNTTKLLSDLMGDVIAALGTINTHTHPHPLGATGASADIKPIVNNQIDVIGLKAKLDGINFG